MRSPVRWCTGLWSTSPMNSVLFGQIRALVAAVGGAAVALGGVSPSSWEFWSGIVLTAGTQLWSAAEKIQARRARK